jgi:hypothetical protein
MGEPSFAEAVTSLLKTKCFEKQKILGFKLLQLLPFYLKDTNTWVIPLRGRETEGEA